MPVVSGCPHVTLCTGANLEKARKEVEKIQPAIITNMAKDSRDKNAGRIIQMVSEKYLMINPIDVGSVLFDRQVEQLISGMVPLTDLEQSSDAVVCAYEIVTKLL